MIGKIYTLQEVAELLQLTDRTVYSYIKNGYLKGFRVGGYWRITEAELKNWIDEGGTAKKDITKSK